MLEKHYRLPAVEEIIGLKRSSIYELIAAGEFPRPVKLSARAVAWRESDIATWMESREAA